MKMDFESCISAAQFAISQSQNTFIIPEFGLNMLATGHVGPTIRIFDVTQPLSFAVFNRVHSCIYTDSGFCLDVFFGNSSHLE